MNNNTDTQPLPATPIPVAPVAVQEGERLPDWEGLKLALNNAVWMHGPSTLTLGEAEAAILLTVEAIAKHYNSRNPLG